MGTREFTQTVEVLNNLPNIADKKYLELGIDAGWTYNNIGCQDKTGVDIKEEAKPDYLMTTDEYFRKKGEGFYCRDEFDLVYIDANHSAMAVMTDFNNATEYLSQCGLIFIHDLGPENENMTGPMLCGDGFKWLFKVRECVETNGLTDLTIITYKDNHGLTMIAGAHYTNFLWSQEELDEVSYKEFARQQAKAKRPTQQEMCLQMRQICDIVPGW